MGAVSCASSGAPSEKTKQYIPNYEHDSPMFVDCFDSQIVESVDSESDTN